METAEQMLDAMDEVLRATPQHLVAMVAAVSDLVSSRPADQKMPKDDIAKALAEGVLVEGVDVLATLTERHAERSYFLGFGAQTVDAPLADPSVRGALLDAGRAKLRKKGCHALFVNRVGVPGMGFGSDTNTGLLLVGDCDDVRDAGPPRPKPALAGWMLDQLLAEATHVVG